MTTSFGLVIVTPTATSRPSFYPLYTVTNQGGAEGEPAIGEGVLWVNFSKHVKVIR